MSLPPRFSVTATSPAPDIRCLAVTGELDLATVAELRASLDDHMGDPLPRSVVVDLTDCPFMDSAGLACLVELWQRLDGSGRGQLILCGLDGPVRRLLDVAGLTGRLRLVPDRETAIAHPEGPSGAASGSALAG